MPLFSTTSIDVMAPPAGNNLAWGHSPIDIDIVAFSATYYDSNGSTTQAYFKLNINGATFGDYINLNSGQTGYVNLTGPGHVAAVSPSTIDSTGRFRYFTNQPAVGKWHKVVTKYTTTNQSDFGKWLLGIGSDDFGPALRVGRFATVIPFDETVNTTGWSPAYWELVNEDIVDTDGPPPANISWKVPGRFDDFKLVIENPNGTTNNYQYAFRKNNVTQFTITVPGTTTSRIYGVDSGPGYVDVLANDKVCWQLTNAGSAQPLSDHWFWGYASDPSNSSNWQILNSSSGGTAATEDEVQVIFPVDVTINKIRAHWESNDFGSPTALRVQAYVNHNPTGMAITVNSMGSTVTSTAAPILVPAGQPFSIYAQTDAVDSAVIFHCNIVYQSDYRLIFVQGLGFSSPSLDGITFGQWIDALGIYPPSIMNPNSGSIPFSQGHREYDVFALLPFDIQSFGLGFYAPNAMTPIGGSWGLTPRNNGQDMVAGITLSTAGTSAHTIWNLTIPKSTTTTFGTTSSFDIANRCQGITPDPDDILNYGGGIVFAYKPENTYKEWTIFESGIMMSSVSPSFAVSTLSIFEGDSTGNSEGDPKYARKWVTPGTFKFMQVHTPDYWLPFNGGYTTTMNGVGVTATGVIALRVNGQDAITVAVDTSGAAVFSNITTSFHVNDGDTVTMISRTSSGFAHAKVSVGFQPDPLTVPNFGAQILYTFKAATNDPNAQIVPAKVSVEGGFADPLGTKKASKLNALANNAGITNSEVADDRFTNAVSGNKLVGSVWLKSANGLTDSVTLNVTSGAENNESTFTITPDWTRYSVALTLGTNGVGPSRLEIFPTNITSVYFFAPQLELKSTTSPSSYIETRREGEVLNWNAAEVILDLIENVQYGLAMPANRDSFYNTILPTEGISDLDGLRIDTCYPSLDQQTKTYKDSIEGLAQIRFFLLDKKAGLWQLSYTKNTAPPIALGTEDTEYANVSQVSGIDFLGTDQLISNIVINYGQTIREDTGEIFFPFRINQTINTLGTELAVDAGYIQNHVTAHKLLLSLADYHSKAIQTLQLTCGNVGRDLVVGQQVNGYFPHDLVENRIINSERVGSTTGWTASNVTLHAGRAPTGRSRTASKLGTNGQVSQGSLPVSQYLDNFFSIYYQSSNPSPFGGITIGIVSTTGYAVTQTFSLTEDWQKARILFNDPKGSGTCTVTIQGSNCNLWGAQYCQRYEYIYTNKTVTAQTSWIVQAISATGNVYQLTLLPYWTDSVVGSQIYTPYDPNINTKLDPAVIPPILAQSIDVPPNPPASTGLAGVDLSPEGVADSWAEIQFIMPPTNISYAVVQYRKAAVDGSPIPATQWQEAGRVRVEDSGYGGKGSVKIRGLTPGLTYEVRVVTFNTRGLNTVSTEYPFISRGDVDAPDQPTKVEVSQGTGRFFNIQVTAALPEDLGYISLYRYTANSFGQAELISKSKKNQFHDTDVDYGITYYYWATVEDLTGNVSDPTLAIDASSNLPGSVVNQIIGIDEIAAGTIFADKLLLDGQDATISNPSFESGNTGWGSLPSQLTITTSVIPRTGVYALRGYDTNPYSVTIFNGSTVSVNADEIWNFEVYGRIATNPIGLGVQNKLTAYIYGYDASGITTTNGLFGTGIIQQGVKILNTTYSKVVAKVTVPVGVYWIRPAINIQAQAFPQITTYIDDARVYQTGAEIRYIQGAPAGVTAANYKIPVFNTNDGSTLGFIKLFTS